jgi:hypothetical protein
MLNAKCLKGHRKGLQQLDYALLVGTMLCLAVWADGRRLLHTASTAGRSWTTVFRVYQKMMHF